MGAQKRSHRQQQLFKNDRALPPGFAGRARRLAGDGKGLACPLRGDVVEASTVAVEHRHGWSGSARCCASCVLPITGFDELSRYASPGQHSAKRFGRGLRSDKTPAAPVRASRARPHQITHPFVGRVSDPDRRQLGGQNRRLAKDFETLAETPATFVTLASEGIGVPLALVCQRGGRGGGGGGARAGGGGARAGGGGGGGSWAGAGRGNFNSANVNRANVNRANVNRANVNRANVNRANVNRSNYSNVNVN